jgi:hypothetical protein
MKGRYAALESGEFFELCYRDDASKKHSLWTTTGVDGQEERGMAVSYYFSRVTNENVSTLNSFDSLRQYETL